MVRIRILYRSMWLLFNQDCRMPYIMFLQHITATVYLYLGEPILVKFCAISCMQLCIDQEAKAVCCSMSFHSNCVALWRVYIQCIYTVYFISWIEKYDNNRIMQIRK